MTSGDKEKCGGRRANSDQLCKQRAGWGTTTPGVGRCKRHGGATPTHRKKAQRMLAEQAVATYGLAREVDPRDALLEEVYRTAGVIDWIAERIRALEPEAVVWGTAQLVEKEIPTRGDEDGEPSSITTTDTTMKAAVNIWVELYQRERKHLREVCRDAIAAGIAERQVRLAEQQGAMLVSVIRAILADLHLSPEQAATIPDVVPRHLRAVGATTEAA